jgi:osmoprotectant transport system ATP-binding protein
MTDHATAEHREGKPMSSTPKIHLEKVGKTYPGTKVPAVEELTLDVQEGEILVLVGPSGCGKSTTLRLINRMIEPSGGQILLDGEDVTKVNPDKLRRRIGYVIQQIGLFPHQTISQNIATVPRMLGWDKDKTKARSEELLGMVGLDPDQYRDRYPKELSGGQAQRVGVARALGADPDIMLMDEPFGAIDPITRERLQNEFLRLQGELRKTIVFVTHDIDEAIKMGDKIAILGERSTIRQIDTPERILAYPVDDFVDDFIGTGSTIKGLNFLKVSSLVLTDYPTLVPGASAEQGQAALSDANREWLVELDESRTPVRWVHADDIATAGDDRGEPIGELLRSDDTLFHALELMVQSASGETCVVDDKGAYQGVVRMVDLAKAIRRAQYEARMHYEELERA